MNIEILREAGLTDGEIKVYLALLELGSSTSGPIVRKSKVAKSIVYPILEKLINKGLVSYIIKQKTKYFQAAQPQKILEYIDERELKLKKNKKQVEKLIPELLLKQSLAPKSEAKIYFGFKGIRTAHEHYLHKLKKGEEYYALGVPAFQPEEQHLYWQRDHVARVKKGIKCKLMFNKDTDPKILKNRNSYKGAEARYMPTDIKTPALFVMFKDTVIILLQSHDAIAVEIVNQEIADSFKAYFDEYWEESEPFRK